MDEKDRLILTIIEDDCNLPVSEIAEMVDLTTDETKVRIKALETSGIIIRYTAVVDWERAGNGAVAVLLELKVSPEPVYGYDRVAEQLSRFREIRSIRLISGVYDFQLLIIGNTIHDIARFIAEHVAPIEQVNETATILIMKTYKENGQEFFERKEGKRLPFSF